MKSYFFPLAMVSLFLGGIPSSVFCNENSLSSNPAYQSLMSNLTRDGFSSEEIKAMLVEVNFQKLTSEEVSWVINKIPSVVSALKKGSLPYTQVNIGRGLVLQEIGAEITHDNLKACGKIFLKLNALNQKGSIDYAYWDKCSYHLLAASLATKKMRVEDILKMLSHVDSKNLTFAEISEVIATLKKSNLTSQDLEKNFDEILSDVEKESQEKKLPSRIPSEIEKRSPSTGFKQLLVGKNLSED
ncbi:MAG: hypothetical protein B7Y25_06670 [Alphaproteobacteria bacterium 16-39-46]|nr:MAG: hypothetical protein B7Y25_06670 [Alphaproteobacteria bacterium 16-39-46]OZA42216.1 MAG: hypothetical protein B7X84_06745 [Alphaproteobacteria bacterium 17-39-52]HQS84567.1 hypothetical protein [Alphaproteobacteria bacterium]HQS94356.1 hypothetical protein [Alphaproteobacteria bacterium]